MNFLFEYIKKKFETLLEYFSELSKSLTFQHTELTTAKKACQAQNQAHYYSWDKKPELYKQEDCDFQPDIHYTFE